MNKYVTLLIIIIIIYITYDYCSNCEIIEGSEGNDNDGGDNDGGDKDEKPCPGKPVGNLSTKTPTHPCQYKQVNCEAMMPNVSKEYGDNHLYSKEVTGQTFGAKVTDKKTYVKVNCANCIHGSEVGGNDTLVGGWGDGKYMANLSSKDAISKYASDTCDAMAAGCEEPYAFAYGQVDKVCPVSPDSLWGKIICAILDLGIVKGFSEVFHTKSNAICSLHIFTKNLGPISKIITDAVKAGMHVG